MQFNGVDAFGWIMIVIGILSIASLFCARRKP